MELDDDAKKALNKDGFHNGGGDLIGACSLAIYRLVERPPNRTSGEEVLEWVVKRFYPDGREKP
jgi:hypothetical protein